MYVRPAATMLPFGRRRACAAPMSAVLASVTVMNAGRWPAWSSATRLQPALRPPDFAHGNIDRHRSIIVESSEYSGFLNRNPCPGDIDRQRSSSAPKKVPAQFPRLFRVHPRERRPRRLADAQVAGLARLRRQVRHDVPKAAPPGQLRHPIATNWLHRDSLRAIRPACPSAPALELMSRHQLEQTPEHRAIVCHGLDPLCSNQTARAIQASFQVNGTVVTHLRPNGEHT